MRVIVFFDLPSVSPSDKKAYLNFRKFLLINGFMMMQESVYCKLTLNQTVSDSVLNSLSKNKPMNGNVQILVITEKQFQKIVLLVGDNDNTLINTDERVLIL
ncbi:MAG: CRISPR-associated endonuclease Cas2 [bacterium]